VTDKNRPDGANDDAYVIEDTGDSVEDIEHEMEVGAAKTKRIRQSNVNFTWLGFIGYIIKVTTFI